MRFIETALAGVFVFEINRFEDERGFYKRLWGKDELKTVGLDSNLNNVGLSFNIQKGTVRGMHYQLKPFAETKLVQCTRGSVYDVVLDIRPQSKTFGKWIAEELTEANNRALYIPRELAHGFQTLEDGSEVLYCISQKYSVEHSRGIRWNDPRFGIELPLPVSVINDRDRSYEDFNI
jgi:dTDP-4-dehydrorhamnose 3,5-epimerase